MEGRVTRTRSRVLRKKGSSRINSSESPISSRDIEGGCCSHVETIACMKDEIVRLRDALCDKRELHVHDQANQERHQGQQGQGQQQQQQQHPQREQENDPEARKVTRVHHGDARSKDERVYVELNRALYDLGACKRELEDAKCALGEALKEHEALRCQLSKEEKEEGERDRAPRGSEDAVDHPHLDWVGMHYLATCLPEDRMFRPGQSVTPVGVLQKLFEMRVGDKQAVGFSILLENANIALCQNEPEWYAKHFGFFARTHPKAAADGGRRTAAQRRIDADDFAWLLFEYGAQAPFVEVLAGLWTVLNSTGKGGVTAVALQLSKNLYAAGLHLFRETVSKASGTFARVHARARKVRAGQGLISVPLTGASSADTGSIPSRARAGSPQSRTAALRSVLEGLEVPPQLSASEQSVPLQDNDPFKIEGSLSAFIARKTRARDSDGRALGKKDGLQQNARRTAADAFSRHEAQEWPLLKRVRFDPLPLPAASPPRELF